MPQHQEKEGREQWREYHFEPLATEKVYSEEQRKKFFLDLMENDRGRFLRLKEQQGERRNLIVIPVESLREIGEYLCRMADWSDKNP